MLVTSIAVTTYTEKEYKASFAILNDWAKKSKVELEITYYPVSNDFSSCHMRDFRIVFVDISTEGDQNGLPSIRMPRKCGTKLPIVLFSDSDRYLMGGYEISALYLIEAFKKIDTEHCTERIFEITSNANLKLRSEDITFCIPYGNILYIRGIGEEPLIVMKEGSCKLCLRLGELDYAFPRQLIWHAMHTLISTKYVRQIEGKGPSLWNDEQLEINLDYRQAVVLAYVSKAN